mmetsp:Transcript_97015/g.156536  ORF Transcript_97015/g.156536 Transcript_97015/m.156536 type:complete len:83 (+) Transcript_97015:3-251(+)
MCVNKNGASCLMIAALNGHASVVEVLCKVGGKPLLMLVDKDGDSCLFIAAYKGHTAVVEILERECKKAGMSQQQIAAFKKRK